LIATPARTEAPLSHLPKRRIARIVFTGALGKRTITRRKTMSIEAMKQALDALEEHGTHYARHEDDYIKAITALRQAIEQAEKQEPIGYLYDWLNPENRDEVIRDWFATSMYVIEKDKGFNVRPLYTAPREWVGLTDEEKEAATGWSVEHIEAKLKEKNNG
jgi:hypothetical protein